MLVLCAVGPWGDDFWDSSNRIFSVPEVGARIRQLRLRATDLFGSETDHEVPASGSVAELVRTKLPPVRIDTLSVGVAVAANEPHAVARLTSLLSGFEGISQVPAQVHLFVLGPDAFIQFSGRLAPLDDLLRMSALLKLHCRDICWVRLGSEPKSIDPAPMADSRIRAATSVIHSGDSEARRVLSILQAREPPLRDSLSCPAL